MSLREITCAGLMLMRPHISDDKQKRHTDILLLLDGRGDFTIPKGRIQSNETEFVAAQRVTYEATGFGPDDYNAFQQFGVVTEDYICKKAIHWVALIKNDKQAVRLSSEYLGFAWVNVNEPSAIADALLGIGALRNEANQGITHIQDNSKGIEMAFKEKRYYW